MTPAAPTAGRGDAGFTLLELAVVLAILAAMAALWGPYLGSGPPRTAVQSMALQLAADLRLTRSEAQRRNVAQTLTIDLAQRAYWSQPGPGPRKFVDGVDVEVSGAGIDWSGDRAARLRFQPNGSATGGRIAIKDRAGAAIVTVDWLTGAARIERMR